MGKSGPGIIGLRTTNNNVKGIRLDWEAIINYTEQLENNENTACSRANIKITILVKFRGNNYPGEVPW